MRQIAFPEVPKNVKAVEGHAGSKVYRLGPPVSLTCWLQALPPSGSCRKISPTSNARDCECNRLEVVANPRPDILN